MKKLNLLALSIIILIGFQACEGPVGPPGLDGLDGVNIVSKVFEVEVNFTQANNYIEKLIFEEANIESDVVLAFIEWEIDGGKSVWRALPQTVFFNEGGVLIYNYDFTLDDFRLFLDGAINPANLGEEWRLNQLFRVIVVPGDYASSRIDFTNYEAVTAMLGLKDEDFKRIDLKK
ncbi:hypothetical protein [Algoriphagus marinus]|uniref:hypothetical protein n=1 Tax=Algoriphagus marinus TaxID=1925762 RepID=UPI00094B8B64|nr:hypothetical protein [Algoriphagus marinus]